MKEFTVQQIGVLRNNEKGMYVELDAKYIPGLTALEGFSHVNVLYWFDGGDIPNARDVLEVSKPYVTGPDVLGVFATRSPARPNPIALTASQVVYMDVANGIIQLAYTDAFDGTPVLDIKPYSPSADTVDSAMIPSWCAHWPKNLEASATFDWEKEFLF